MKSKLFTASLLVAGCSLLMQGPLMNVLLGLILTGTLPGVSKSIPFWVMMAIYTATISLLITWYIEGLIASRRAYKDASVHRRLPRRHYSHI